MEIKKRKREEHIIITLKPIFKSKDQKKRKDLMRYIFFLYDLNIAF